MMQSALRPLELNETPQFPRCIEIQTTNICNARCGACPYAETTGLERKQRMDDTLFERIIAECSEHQGEIERLIPYLNNEPFADPSILDRLRLIRDRVSAHVELSTNASLLTPERSRALLEEDLVHTLRISMFGSDEVTYERRMHRLRWHRTFPNVEALLRTRRELQREDRVDVEMIMVGTPDLTAEEVAQARSLWNPLGAKVRIFGYLDRAANNGQARNLLPAHQGWGRLRGCELNRPFERMAIRVDGACVLCSQDWRAHTVLGNVTDQTLAEIWRSTAYSRVRRDVSGEGVAPADSLCRRCKLAIVE